MSSQGLGEPVGKVDLGGGKEFHASVHSGGGISLWFTHDSRNYAGPAEVTVRRAEEIAELLTKAVEVAPVIYAAQQSARTAILAVESRYERIVATAIGEHP